jgi:hypothetical protein
VVNLKGKCRNCGAIRHKAKDCKLKTNQNNGQNRGNHNNFQKSTSNGAYCTYCCRPGHIKSNFYKLKKNATVTVIQVTMTVKDTEFLIPKMLRLQQLPSKLIFQVTCGFLIVELAIITADLQKG